MSRITLTSNIKQARHFTSHKASFAVVEQLREAHGYDAAPLYSYVTVRFMGKLLFVSFTSGV